MLIGGSEDGKKTKSVRALDARDAEENDDSDGLDQRDRLEDDDDEETAKAPPGFLSPSVREYLELGRSIPGTCFVTQFVRFFFKQISLETRLNRNVRPG